ncbi:MAG: VWA domain-containing protein [Candidatus Thermoplasmatota archaeon]|nr:VWA domain-containing protein [Candidatus Thermoplasmatota archaeon]
MKSFDPSKQVTTKAKPLPVYLLLDVSDSMTGEKIATLNRAAKEMIETFAQEERMENEILVSIITFGGEARLHLPPTKASSITWANLEADGMTPLGAAMTIAKGVVEDKKVTPSRAYRPTIVLVSDGQPNDKWRPPLDDFISNGRSAKCDRMAMAIGPDADEDVLTRFIAGTQHQLFYAEHASQIPKFFEYVTISVTTRANSKNPNEIPADDDIKLDGSTEPQTAPSGDSGASDPTEPSADAEGDEGYW